MKGFFLTVLALLFGIAAVRFLYGLQANESAYFVQVILNLPPDVKEDFMVIREAVDSFSLAVQNLKNIGSMSGDLLDVLKAFFKAVGSFFAIPIAVAEFVFLVVQDLGRALASLFNLLFAPAVVPISPPAEARLIIG